MSSLFQVNLDTIRRLRLLIETDKILFPGLRKLNLSGKDLEMLPREIFVMEDIDVLDLSPAREACMEFKIGVIPREIGQMSNLKVLIVDTSGLKEVPRELSFCASLEKLSLSNNLIARLPESFSTLQQLTSLHLANNMLSQFPKMLCDIATLEFIDLSDNKIGRIPPVIAQLEKLMTLLIFKNKIMEVPESIGDLSELRTFWIGENKIKRLPRQIANLKHLDWGESHTPSAALDGNPLVYPPLTICKQGPKALKDFFSSAQVKFSVEKD